MSVPIADPFSLLEGDRLTDVIAWSHRFLRSALRPGDLALDLTAGTGQDTLFLFRCIGSNGRVLAFDIQEAALRRTRERLVACGAAVRTHEAGADPPAGFGVHLVRDCHSRLSDYLSEAPRAVIANLGYLPGSDGSVKTEPESTLASLEAAFDHLAPGGRIAVVVYVGHPGGAEEGAAVEARFRELPAKAWQVLRLEAANRGRAPFLLLAQKGREGKTADRLLDGFALPFGLGRRGVRW